MAYAAEAIATSPQMRFEHRLNPTAEAQVGVTDDTGAMTRFAVNATGAHGRGAIDELGFAHVFHLDGAAGA